MIVNSKFRPPIELTESIPIKKNFDFYKTTGNLWDSKYLTSPKISRYYHDIQESFLAGPKSPYNLSLQESLEKSKVSALKAQTHKKLSQELLKRRKNERLHLTSSNISELSQKKKPEIPITPVNAWERLSSVPVCTLRHAMPTTVINKDSNGIQNILNKSAELDKLNQWFESQRQGKRLKARLAIINRHNERKSLEEKCGIVKVREKGVSVGTFGYVRSQRVRERTDVLSKPHTASQGSRYDHQDFRGLLHADHYEAVEKVCSLENTRVIGKD